jgi:hypothetical protein
MLTTLTTKGHNYSLHIGGRAETARSSHEIESDCPPPSFALSQQTQGVRREFAGSGPVYRADIIPEGGSRSKHLKQKALRVSTEERVEKSGFRETEQNQGLPSC